ncbi:MAG: DJ-1/PfpI family protein [Candidatus Dehalobacter alkaniphilus]|uniref:DJ-1/PfpI family protein n=1 Tax=Dehalobacter sp. DCM TaxID=2907827 RepID=UPI003081C368|nr:DJ-1/PfpI family protein [Dehalobacter sp. DCM]
MTEKKVLLFLGEGFEDLEAVTVLSVCGWTEYRSHLEKVKVETTGLHREVHGRFGLRIAIDHLIDEVDPQEYAALVVPGGFHSHGFDEAYCQPLRDLAKTIHRQGGIIATMCVGILPIAESGLLEGGEATSYAFSRSHDNLGRLRELGCKSTSGPIVVWNRIISCSGPAYSVDVASLLLASLVGIDEAKEIALFMAGTSV